MGADKPAIDVAPHVLAYLHAQNTLTLATVSPSGLPHAATLIYVSDGLALYFCTRAETTTARNIGQNPSVSFAIDEYSPDWSKTKGIQGRGEGQALREPREIERVVGLFRKKFPFLSSAYTGDASFFRIIPSEIQFIDNAAATGEKMGETLGVQYRRSLVYSVFRELPRGEIEAVAAKLGTLKVDPGEVIVRQGGPADKFFIIVDGEVEVIREDDREQAPRRPAASLKRGQFFGEIALVRDMPRTATVRAVTPTTLLTMDRDVFRGLVAQSLATSEDFDRVIRQRLSELKAGGER